MRIVIKNSMGLVQIDFVLHMDYFDYHVSGEVTRDDHGCDRCFRWR
jgi:hypothetical protein